MSSSMQQTPLPSLMSNRPGYGGIDPQVMQQLIARQRELMSIQGQQQHADGSASNSLPYAALLQQQWSNNNNQASLLPSNAHEAVARSAQQGHPLQGGGQMLHHRESRPMGMPGGPQHTANLAWLELMKHHFQQWIPGHPGPDGMLQGAGGYLEKGFQSIRGQSSSMALEQDSSKRCSTCGNEKAIDSFGVGKGTGKVFSTCKVCLAKKGKKTEAAKNTKDKEGELVQLIYHENHRLRQRVLELEEEVKSLRKRVRDETEGTDDEVVEERKRKKSCDEGVAEDSTESEPTSISRLLSGA